MKFHANLIRLSFLGLVASAASSAYHGPSGPKTHLLRAAQREAYVLTQDNRVRRRSAVDLVFAERSNNDHRPVLRSRVQAQADRDSILNIEEFDQRLNFVRCALDGSSIILGFRDQAAFEEGVQEARDLSDGIVITSHGGCNLAGERRPYKIKNISVNDVDRTIHLTVQKGTWKELFSGFTVDMEYSTERHMLRSEEPLDRSNTKFRRWPLLPRGDNNTDTTISLEHDLINKGLTFDGEGFIPIMCKNCSTFGEIKIKSGHFHFVDPPSLDVRGAWVEFDFIGVGAFMEFQSNLAGAHDIPIPLFTSEVRFTVFGVLTLSVTPSFDLDFQLAVTRPVNLTYGFTATVPAGSNIHVDFLHTDRSHVDGLADTTFRPLPFRSSIQPAQVNVSAALQPRVDVEVSFGLEDILDVFAQGGLGLDLPRLSLELDAKAPGSVDAQCNALPVTNSSGRVVVAENVLSPAQREAHEFFAEDRLVEMEVDAGFDLFVDGSVGAHVIFIPIEVGGTTTLLETKTTLATACLSYDQAKQTFTPAPAVLSSLVSSSVAASRSSVAASRSLAAADATSTSSGGAGHGVKVPRVGGGGLEERVMEFVLFVTGLLLAL